MKSRRLVVLAVVTLSFFLGRWSKSFTNVVVPGKTVRLVSVGTNPVNPEVMVFTVMSPDDKLIGLFDAPQDACEAQTRLMPPRTFRLEVSSQTADNPYRARVYYNLGDLPAFTPAPHFNRQRGRSVVQTSFR